MDSGGITSYTGFTKVRNRFDSSASVGAIVHLSYHNSIWIQESYNKVVTEPWYITSTISYREGYMTDAIQNRINQYLEDTIGAERNFEKALATFGNAGELTEVQAMLSVASAKVKTHHERLDALPKKPGGTPS